MPKRKPTIAEPAETSDASARPIELVVRRGALWRFNTLKRKTAELPVTVLWDRRQAERRSASAEVRGERRRSTDRRQKPPFTWELADFVVVGQTSTAAGAAKKRKRKKKA